MVIQSSTKPVSLSVYSIGSEKNVWLYVDSTKLKWVANMVKRLEFQNNLVQKDMEQQYSRLFLLLWSKDCPWAFQVPEFYGIIEGPKYY